MTCGGRNKSSKLWQPQQKISGIFIVIYLFISDNIDSCYSLEKGRWVKKASMIEPRNGFSASPYPETPNSLMVTAGQDQISSEILLPGEPWKKGPDFPGNNHYLSCQATLGPSIAITGRYLSNIVPS